METPVSSNGVPAPPRRPSSGTPGRILTFIVDDGTCATSASGMRAAREGIEKFIREQMEPTDMVAIYKTRSGSSVFQQYTNDKAQLLKAAGRSTGGAHGALATISTAGFQAQRQILYQTEPNGASQVTIESDAERKIRERSEDRVMTRPGRRRTGRRPVRRQRPAKGAGAKGRVFMSDGIPLRAAAVSSWGAQDALRSLTDLSNRRRSSLTR